MICPEEQLRPATGIVGLLVIVLTAGCVGAGAPSQTGATQGGAVVVTPPQTDATQGGAVAVEPVVSPATPSTTGSTSTSAAKTDTPASKTPAKVPASPASAAQIQKKESAAPVIAKPGPPPLDLTTLEKRLRETNAIGAFTKLTLKNQVNALLDQFRAYYQGRAKTTLAALRQPYDLLLLKVLSLLQDSDPSLASAIVASREAIWSILSDPAKFSNL